MYFRPDDDEIVLHGTWLYGEVVNDVAIFLVNALKRPAGDLRLYSVIIGRPGHRGVYMHPFADSQFVAVEDAIKAASKRLAVHWDE